MNVSEVEKLVVTEVDRVVVNFAGGDRELDFDNDVREVELIEYDDTK